MIDMFAVRKYEEEIRRSIFKVGKISNGPNGSDVRRKAIPQICPTRCGAGAELICFQYFGVHSPC